MGGLILPVVYFFRAASKLVPIPPELMSSFCAACAVSAMGCEGPCFFSTLPSLHRIFIPTSLFPEEFFLNFRLDAQFFFHNVKVPPLNVDPPFFFVFSLQSPPVPRSPLFRALI